MATVIFSFVAWALMVEAPLLREARLLGCACVALGDPQRLCELPPTIHGLTTALCDAGEHLLEALLMGPLLLLLGRPLPATVLQSTTLRPNMSVLIYL